MAKPSTPRTETPVAVSTLTSAGVTYAETRKVFLTLVSEMVRGEVTEGEPFTDDSGETITPQSFSGGFMLDFANASDEDVLAAVLADRPVGVEVADAFRQDLSWKFQTRHFQAVEVTDEDGETAYEVELTDRSTQCQVEVTKGGKAGKLGLEGDDSLWAFLDSTLVSVVFGANDKKGLPWRVVSPVRTSRDLADGSKATVLNSGLLETLGSLIRKGFDSPKAESIASAEDRFWVSVEWAALEVMTFIRAHWAPETLLDCPKYKVVKQSEAFDARSSNHKLLEPGFDWKVETNRTAGGSRKVARVFD